MGRFEYGDKFPTEAVNADKQQAQITRLSAYMSLAGRLAACCLETRGVRTLLQGHVDRIEFLNTAGSGWAEDALWFSVSG